MDALSLALPVSPWPQSKESLGKYLALLKLQELISSPQGRQSEHPAVKYGPTKSHPSHPTPASADPAYSRDCQGSRNSLPCHFSQAEHQHRQGSTAQEKLLSFLFPFPFSGPHTGCEFKMLQLKRWSYLWTHIFKWQWLLFRMILEDKSSKYSLGFFLQLFFPFFFFLSLAASDMKWFTKLGTQPWNTAKEFLNTLRVIRSVL